MHAINEKPFALLRIAFGAVWLIDASFKWNPAFINNFTDYLTEGAQGQPALVQDWIYFWVHTVSVGPHFFAIVVALGETAIAIGLLFGFLTRVALLGGFALTLVIWSTAEGFGGPYLAGSTDIGAAIIYAMLFVALWLSKCWRHYSLDLLMQKRTSFSIGPW